MTLKQRIGTCLWFDGQAEEAANFYTSIFKNAKITGVVRSGDNGPGPKGSVLTASFELDGHTFLGLNGGPMFKFSEAISMIVNCGDQDEIDYYWDRLSAGGAQQQCGWLKDKYGVSWQIVPAILSDLMTSKDAAASGRVMAALMQMAKLDIAKLKAAAQS